MGNCFSRSEPDADDWQKTCPDGPLNFLTNPKHILDPNNTVYAVHIVAQMLPAHGENHWTFFLQVGPDQSVRIDMTTSDGSEGIAKVSPEHGYRGQLEIALVNCSLPMERHFSLSIPTSFDTRVTKFLDTIVRAGHHDYVFTADGGGCSGWVIDQYHLFLEQGLIQPGFDAIENAVCHEWKDGRPIIERPVTHGFYKKELPEGTWDTE